MSEPLRVLIVEDSPDDALLVADELRRGGFDPIFERVETAASLASALNGKSWDLIISDFSMPGFDGPAALALYQTTSLDIPFICVSGVMGEESAVEMMKAGADDYVMKSNLSRLGPAVRRELRAAEERRVRRQVEIAQALLASIVESCEDILPDSVFKFSIVSDQSVVLRVEAPCRRGLSWSPHLYRLVINRPAHHQDTSHRTLRVGPGSCFLDVNVAVGLEVKDNSFHGSLPKKIPR